MTSASQLVQATRRAFETGKTKPVDWRIQQLRRVYDMMVEQEETLTKAVHADLRKAKEETMMLETIVCKNEALNAIKNIRSWTKPTYATKTLLQIADTMYLQKEPLGVVLIIGAWNYPVQLIILPLIAAISAGNCVIVKPSELSENTAKAFAHLIPRYLDKECFPVFSGGIPETTAILKERFDHIFYTGSSKVGKIVMAAAAEHLTPVTLELGGKSPAYVGAEGHMPTVAKRLLWGKLCNAGQTCVAPDYVICHKSVVDSLLNELKKGIAEMVGEDPKASPDYGRIVNERHFGRISKILEDMPKEKVVVGGEVDAETRYIVSHLSLPGDVTTRYVTWESIERNDGYLLAGKRSSFHTNHRFAAPTLYKNVTSDDAVMKDELFAPILPVMTVGDVDEAVNIINADEKPLAVYIFSNNSKVVEKLLSMTSSGGVCVNDCFMHCSSHNMPFGGVGNSGYGRYHGKWGFDNLSHEKPVCWRGQGLESLQASRYMPYSDAKSAMIRRLTEDKQGSSCAVM